MMRFVAGGARVVRIIPLDRCGVPLPGYATPGDPVAGLGLAAKSASDAERVKDAGRD